MNQNFLYTFLSSLFATSIVTANLIFQKYITLNFFGIYNFEISVGVLLYPITFIISDLISEFYGKAYAFNTIRNGIIIATIIMLMVMGCNFLPATTWSKVDNQLFDKVFGVFYLAFFASLTAVAIGQIIDVKIFVFIKNITGNKHIWLRNNLSTIIAQIVDNICVQSLLYAFNIIARDQFAVIFWDNLFFKIIISILSTPLFYVGYYLIGHYKTHNQSSDNNIGISPN
ncbi:queuosine precursor transporter [Rickettsiales endosymbiont of Stachyamoeba lipophora]|uniref:queuosine precursor transporter n=1 Tax=Rickettsiales endosymbiont of Stachyamoeba lipophora TaxID=2486578 RepID=UPI000F64F2BC|nr:queuosine precursor transporter [Rickettsiales endosymbiont of Stachyamoeba lipophora]AZL15916.1 VUT family protein [Rickettsiales endosymbiont of Stachyamoeba lipophora]